MFRTWKRRILYFALGFVWLMPLMVQAQDAEPLAPPEITGEVIYIPFPVEITLDGDLSDWEGVPQTLVDRGTMLSPIAGENDHFVFAAAANDDLLYVMMTMPDQNIIAGQHGTDFWNEDSLEFYVNLTGNLNAESYTDGILQINVSPVNIGNTDPTQLMVTGVNAAANGVQGIVFATEDGWGFEASLPITPPQHGDVIGFQAHANGATESDRDVKLIWSMADVSDQSWQNPSVFGSGLFFEIGRTDIPSLPDPVVVEATATPETEEETVTSQRAITVANQVGYFVGQQKIAVHGRDTALDTPPAWELRDVASGEVVSSGTTTGGSLDSNSADYVYQADFSAFETTGSYIISIGGVDSQPFQIGNDIYSTLRRDALTYFYLNRSGIELTEEFAGEWARAAGHISDNDVTCFSGDAADGSTWDGCDYRLDAQGGWYDAGDYGKYVVNGGISTWTLVNFYERTPNAFPDGSLNIPESGNGVADILDEARWEMEFLLDMQVPEGQALEGMAHHKLHDLRWSGVPSMMPTEMDNDDTRDGRFLMPPSTAATLNLAAAAAQCARVWREIDAEFADRCLVAAERAWVAANAHPDMLYGSIPGQGGGDYNDGNVQDEFYWAAAELYITTGADQYREYLNSSPYFNNLSSGLPIWWGGTAGLGAISLAVVPNGLPEADVTRIREQIIAAADAALAITRAEGYRAPIAANEYVWGSNSGVLNKAILLALAYDFTGEQQYLDGVIASMDYLLGTNAVNQSFVSGYGTISMEHPHHRFWGNSPSMFPPPPPGSLAGGPNAQPSDPPAIERVSALPIARRYIDDIGSYSTNEVAINWNAPLVWVTAYLNEQLNGQ